MNAVDGVRSRADAKFTSAVTPMIVQRTVGNGPSWPESARTAHAVVRGMPNLLIPPRSRFEIPTCQHTRQHPPQRALPNIRLSHHLTILSAKLRTAAHSTV